GRLKPAATHTRRGAQNGVQPPCRNFGGTVGSGFASLKRDFRYVNAARASASEILSLCDSISESQRVAVRCPIAEHARLWQEPQLFTTVSRPGPGGKISATFAGSLAAAAAGAGFAAAGGAADCAAGGGED